jgi:Ca2+-binding EF-hand superfamily protein
MPMRTSATRTLIAAAVLAALPAVLLADDASTPGSDAATTPPSSTAPAPAHHGRRHGDLFKRWDTNGDGQITRDEAQAAAAAHALDRFDKLDLNKDGVVTRAEIQQARPAQRAGFKQKFEARFQAAEASGQGGLTKAEAAATFPRLARHFDRLDTDKDGILTLQEVEAGWQRHRHPATQPTT